MLPTCWDRSVWEEDSVGELVVGPEKEGRKAGMLAVGKGGVTSEGVKLVVVGAALVGMTAKGLLKKGIAGVKVGVAWWS